jgi:hypothetical protein
MRVLGIWEGTLNATLEQMQCFGCKSDNIFINCAQCVMRPCAISKGVEFCIECEEYPCGYYEAGKQMVNQLPYLKHMKAIIKNQRYIKDQGVEPWLEDQKTKWECPQCGVLFAWYEEECKHCGRDLRGIKDYETLTDEDIAF